MRKLDESMRLQLKSSKIAESVIVVQRRFPAHFMLCKNDGVQHYSFNL